MTLLAVYEAILLALVSVLGVGLLLMDSFNGVAMHLYVCIYYGSVNISCGHNVL